jgi:hypothetical protein
MRTGISITLKPADRRRLATLARDRNAPRKHVWRAEIVLLSADGIGTNEIMRRTGKSKTCVWRWQERFMVVREGRREAFTGESAGEVLSGVRQVGGADVFRPTESNTAGVDIARHMRTRVVVDPGMRRSLLHGNREISIVVLASRDRDVVGKAGGRSRR